MAALQHVAERGTPGWIAECDAATIQKAEREYHPRIGYAEGHEDCQHHGRGHHEASTDDHDHPAAVVVGNRRNEDGEKEGRQVDEARTRATITSDVETVAISKLSATVCISQPRLESWDARKVRFFNGASKPVDAFSSIEGMADQSLGNVQLSPVVEPNALASLRCQTIRFDCHNSSSFIVVRRVPCDSDSANYFTAMIAYQNAAGRGDDFPAGDCCEP